jgi:hypothetical protein
MYTLAFTLVSKPVPLSSFAPLNLCTLISLHVRNSAHQHRIQPAFAPPNVRKALYWQHSCIPLLTNMWNTLVKPEIRRIANQQEFKKRVNSELDLSFVRAFA